MSGLLLLVAHVWGLSVLIFLLHYYNPRFGFAPLMMVIGGITALSQSQLSIYVEPIPGFYMFIGSNVIIPVLLMAVLMIYVANGAVPARLTVYSIIGVSILTLVALVLYRVYLSLQNGGSFSGLSADQLVPTLDLRLTAGSLIAFLADMFVIAVFYQGVRNYAPKLPEEVVIGLSLVAALWTDAMLFRFIVDFGTPEFLTLMPGDVLGKTLSAIMMWLPLGFYLTRVAPNLPGHVGSANRRTLDVLFGSFEEIKMALVRTEQALAMSEQERRSKVEYIELISEHVEEALWLIGPNPGDSVFYVNAAYERLWGRSAASIYADPMSFIDSLHPEDRERIVAGMARQFDDNYEVEFRIMRPDGAMRWIRDRAFAVYDEKGVLYRRVGISEDITERKLLEKQQLDLAVEREKVKLLRDFIGEASHDLKNPLTSMSLKVEHLKRTQDVERRAQHLADLEMLVDRMSKMIDDLLLLARLENLNELKLTKLNITQVVNDICEAMRPMIEDKKLELSLDLNHDDVSMYASTNDLERALTNLIENAVNYTPQGGMVSVQAQSGDTELVVRVTDTGIGIPEAEQQNVFNRFYRAANTKDISGTGLGLAIVKKVIDQHRGRIEITSVVGTGTTFTVHLPRAM